MHRLRELHLALALSAPHDDRAESSRHGKAEAAWFRHQRDLGSFRWGFPKDERMGAKAAPTRLARACLVSIVNAHSESKLHTE